MEGSGATLQRDRIRIDPERPSAARSCATSELKATKSTALQRSMKTLPQFHRFTDSQLIDVMPRVILGECSATAVVVAGLMEFDTRRLFLPLGYPSLFQYCIQALHLTEDATFNRLEAARAARKYPQILGLLQAGELSLTAVRLLAPHLTADNQASLLDAARHKTKRELELLIAKTHPQPPVPSIVRKLPERKPAENSVLRAEPSAHKADEPAAPTADAHAAPPPPPSRRPVVAALSAARERLKQIQALMRHRLPSGDPAAIVEHALEVLHIRMDAPRRFRNAGPGR